MKEFKDNRLSERLSRATAAKLEMRDRAKLPDADSAVVIERRIAREAIAAARVQRAAVKAQAAVEKSAREAAERLENEARAKSAALAVADREVALAAEQKSARDVRYAARKLRSA